MSDATATTTATEREPLPPPALPWWGFYVAVLTAAAVGFLAWRVAGAIVAPLVTAFVYVAGDLTLTARRRAECAGGPPAPTEG